MAADPSDSARIANIRDSPLLGGVESDWEGSPAALLLDDSPTPQDHAGEALAAGAVDNPSNPSNQTNDIGDHLVVPLSQDTVIPLSQDTIPLSPQGPASPSLNDPSASFKTEPDERDHSPAISASLTPPSSSRFTPVNPVGSLVQAMDTTAPGPSTAAPPLSSLTLTRGALDDPQSSGIFSPPATIATNAAAATAPTTARRDGAIATAESAAVGPKGFTAPTPRQIADASADELRGLLQAFLAEHARLKMEAAHHKLQFHLLSLQADDDAKRAAVEHEMMRREAEALRAAEQMARRSAMFSKATRGDSAAVAGIEPSAVATAQRNLQLQAWCDRLVADNEALDRRWRLAKKVIRQKDSELMDLRDERDMALNRIRENREHMQILCSPGGMFHGAYTPKAGQQHQHQVMPAATPGQPAATPGGSKATPRHDLGATGRPTPRGDREHDHRKTEGLSVLIQAMSQENNHSAPSTPTNAGAGYHHHHASVPQRLGGGVGGVGALATALGGARAASLRHTRNVQSMSSLPTTPAARTFDGIQRVVHAASGPNRGPGYGTGLLPSVDLVPQSAPPYRRSQGSSRGGDGAYANESHFPPATPTRPTTRDRERRKSRESTISADEMEPEDEDHSKELARQALQSVAAAAAASFAESERTMQQRRGRSGGNRDDSTLSSPRKSKRPGKAAPRGSDAHHGAGATGRGQQKQKQVKQEQRNDDDGDEEEDDEEIQESQASLEALEMLRRDPRESFDVLSSVGGSRDGTPELGARPPAKKRPGGTRSGAGPGPGAGEKRKYSPGGSSNASARGEAGGDGDRAPGSDMAATATATATARRELGSPAKRLRVAGGLRGDSRRVGLGIQYGTGA